MNEVYINKIKNKNYVEPMHDAIKWIGLDEKLAVPKRVIIKPNMTWEEHIPGITVTPFFLESLIRCLKEYTNDIMFVESDGGQNTFAAKDSFKNHGLYELKDKYAIKCVNLTKEEKKDCLFNINNKTINIEIPKVLLNDDDILISVPVPKIHAMTRVTLAFKNLWGCIPCVNRFRYHPYFGDVIAQFVNIININYVIFDGTYFLNRQGPMAGDEIRKDLLIASNNLGAGSLACCNIMGVSPEDVRHFHTLQKYNLFDFDGTKSNYKNEPNQFKDINFYLNRTFMNYIQLIAFKSEIIMRFIHYSFLSSTMKKIYRRIKEMKIFKKILYGDHEPFNYY